MSVACPTLSTTKEASATSHTSNTLMPQPDSTTSLSPRPISYTIRTRSSRVTCTKHSGMHQFRTNSADSMPNFTACSTKRSRHVYTTRCPPQVVIMTLATPALHTLASDSTFHAADIHTEGA